MRTLTYLTVVILLIFVSCKDEDKTNKEVDKVRIKITNIEEIDYSGKIRASGVLSSKKEAKLSFKTGGIIKEINFDEGDVVSKGDVIASLNLREINAMLQQAKLSVEKSQRDLQRIENLFKDSVATLEQFQNAKTALDYATSNLEIAKFNKEYSKIVAPSNGKILKRLAEENELIAAGYPVVMVSSNETDWIIRTSISDVDVVKLKVNDSAYIYLDAFKNQTIKAFVSEISAFADPYTGTFEVELKLDNPPKEILSGMIAKIDIYSSKSDKFLKVPIEAQIEGNESTAYVYVFKDEKAVKTKVNVAEISNNYLLISAGLKKGEKIIFEGVNYVKPNSVFEVVD